MTINVNSYFITRHLATLVFHNNVAMTKDKCRQTSSVQWSLKGCGMGPSLVLVSPCFRENVVATCKIGSFLCSLDNLLQKNVTVLFFGNQIWKKGLFLSYFSHFLVTREKLQKFLQHISHSHTYTYFAHPIARGGHLYFRLDIIRVKGFSKHTLNTYFSGMKIDPKYAFLLAFFLIWASCPFKNLSIWPKTYPFFQFCTFLHP